MKFVKLFFLLPFMLSCKSEKTEDKLSVETCTVFVEQTLMKPYTGYEVSEAGIKLSGQKNPILPIGNISVTLEGIGDKHFAIGFDREILLQKFDGFFGTEYLTSIEYYDENDELVVLGKDSKAFMSKYREFLSELDLNETTLYVFFDLPTVCYKKLPNLKDKTGFTRCFSQKIGGGNPKLIYNPWIKMNRLVFMDLKSKGLLRNNDLIYVNCGSQKGYTKHRVKDLEIPELKKQQVQ